MRINRTYKCEYIGKYVYFEKAACRKRYRAFKKWNIFGQFRKKVVRLSLSFGTIKKISKNQRFLRAVSRNFENHRENKNACNAFYFRDDSSNFEKPAAKTLVSVLFSGFCSRFKCNLEANWNHFFPLQNLFLTAWKWHFSTIYASFLLTFNRYYYFNHALSIYLSCIDPAMYTPPFYFSLLHEISTLMITVGHYFYLDGKWIKYYLF